MREKNLLITSHYFDGSAVFWLTIQFSDSPTMGHDCNQSAMAGFAAARGWAFRSFGMRRESRLLLWCELAEFGEPTLNRAVATLECFGEFRDGCLRVECIGKLLVFGGRPRLAVVGGHLVIGAVALCGLGGWVSLLMPRGWVIRLRQRWLIGADELAILFEDGAHLLFDVHAAE